MEMDRIGRFAFRHCYPGKNSGCVSGWVHVPWGSPGKIWVNKVLAKQAVLDCSQYPGHNTSHLLWIFNWAYLQWVFCFLVAFLYKFIDATRLLCPLVQPA